MCRGRRLLGAVLPMLLAAGCVRAGFDTGRGSRRGDRAGAERGADGNADRTSDRALDLRAADAHVLRYFAVQLPGQANIYGAGHSAPPAPGGGSGGILPAEVPVPSGVSRVMQLISASGTIDRGGAQGPVAPDGDSGGTPFTDPSCCGLAGLTSRGSALVGVFLDDTEPADPPPNGLNVGDASFAELSPALRQIFWLGDGLTGIGSGARQIFHVPAAATRLFLGIADCPVTAACTLPGSYQDNTGVYAIEGVIYLR
jgi:hypothetical protein